MRLGDVLYPQRLVRGFPQDIPSGAAVTVRGFAHFTKTGKWSKRPHADGRTRVRVEYRGHEYWVDAEALSAEKPSYSANPMTWQAVFENPRRANPPDFWWRGSRLRWRGYGVADLGTEKRKALARAVLDEVLRRKSVSTPKQAEAIGSALQHYTRNFMLKGLTEREAYEYVLDRVLAVLR